MSSTFNSRMHKSVLDKLFFVNEVEVDTLVDFGCADGYLLSKYKSLKPNVNCIGYDRSDYMIKEAKKRDIDVQFVNYWKDISLKGTSAILFSSVLHECEIPNNELRKLTDPFDYIIIRDMHLANISPNDLKFLQKLGHISLQDLMKMQFMDNIENELKEDYFSYDGNFPTEKKLKYEEKFMLPWYKYYFHETFGIEFETLTTHIKQIYANNNR